MLKKWFEGVSEKQLYIVIIVSVATLIIINQFISQKLLNKVAEEEYATFLAGQMANESQKLETLSLRATIDSSYFDQLKKDVETWYQMDQRVKANHSAMQLSKADTEQVHIYLARLHEQSDELYAMIQSLDSAEELRSNIDRVIELENQYSETANELYTVLEKISDDQISSLRWIEIVVALISLILLWLEFQFIVRPIIEELRKRKEKLEQLNKSKDRILATVAHDIRNPISGIQGLLGILIEQTEKLEPDDVELIDLCIESCKKAESLIKELLEISLLESEDYHLETELIHMEQYLKGVLTQFKPKADEKNIELRLKIEPKSLEAKVDKNQFSRAIENIIGNAIKFTKEGQVEIYSRQDKENVIIEIRDTGIGIPEKLKEYIFDKFSRARRLGTKGETTTGLGMSIVKTIVEKHGGRIWLDSQEGKGTVFFITLPKE